MFTKTLTGRQGRNYAVFRHKRRVFTDATQQLALECVTGKKPQKSSAPSLVNAAAILEDKARTARGQATSLNVSALLEIAEIIRGQDRGAGR